MRSRWEEKYTEPSDEQVTLTESQLRSLKRGAAIGMVAAILAVIAVGIAGYSLVSARSISSDVLAAKSSTAETAQPAPEEATPAAPTTAPAVQPAAGTAPTPAPTPAAAAAPAVKPAPETQTPKKSSVVVHKATARTHQVSRSIEEKPVTIPAAAPEPAIAPQPVAPEPIKLKAAAHDSSAAH